MKWLFEVHADHPSLKRVDELQLTEVEKNDFVAELKDAGYENIKAEKDLHFEAGDEIEITSFMYEDTFSDEAKNLIWGILVQKAANCNLDLKGLTPDKVDEKMTCNLFPLRLKLVSERIDRYRVVLFAEWIISDINATKQIKCTTNIYGLRKLGLKFIDPECEEIPLMNSDDDILYEHELVVKHYALQNKVSAEEAQEVIDKVQSAMSKNGIVFYRP